MQMRKKSVCLAASCLMTCVHAQDIVLNELLASNALGHSDIVDFEDYADWIELRNTTGVAVSLDGYFLSDDAADPFKWAVPSGAAIDANGYFLIWADGHDAGPGETHPRGYWPWVGFTTENYHTNFKFSSMGESLTLTKATGITSQVLIVAENVDPVALPDPIREPGTVWKYLDDGSDQSTQWRARTYDDSLWASGASQLGYGDPGDAEGTGAHTLLDFGGDSNNKHITAYFRHTFNVTDPTAFHGLSARMMADDGAVVYLNGVEVRRVRIPAGNVNYKTLATGTFTEGVYEPFNIPASLLIAGANVIAVEIHQVQTNSSDISFDFELMGKNHTVSTQEDTVTFGEQITDVSYGRDPGNTANWLFFGEPSPLADNNGSIVPAARVVSSDVNFSLVAGFYTGTQLVTLTTADGGAQIHYTMNGDLPDSSSSVYSAPLSVASTAVIRARAIESGRVPGATRTRTYFFGETPGDVSFVSVVTDDANLFDPVKGIYYNTHEPLTPSGGGKRNAYKGKEVPVSFEFFETDGSIAQSVNAGARIGGENNWRNEQRSLTIYMRGKYGDDSFEYPLFDNSCVGSIGRMVLRNGGDNWSKAMLRDALIPDLIGGRVENDLMDYRPCVVFINGEYWGIHNIREKFDDQYFVSRYHVDPSNYDHCEFGHITSGSTTFGVVEGNADHYLEMEDFVKNNDMSVAANYAFVESRMDIDSLIDFAIIQDFVYNSSWVHNREFWRERKPGAKWRWLMPDLDRGLDINNVTSNLLDDLVNGYALFSGMMDNPGFRDRLIQRYCAHMASTFNATRMATIVDDLDAEVSGEVARHVALWSVDGGMNLATRTAELLEIKSFATLRPAEVLIDLTAQFTLGATATLTLTQSSSNAGKIYINGVLVSPEATVVTLYTGIPFEITAVANSGHAFTGWTGATGGAETTLTLVGDLSVTALFSTSMETVVPASISTNTTLSAANSPYASEGDIVIDASTTLTIEPGVELRMPAGANLRVLGSLQVLGTELAPVHILARDAARWGGISFENSTSASQLNHLTIRGASKGPHPSVYKAAISALNSTLVMDGLDLDEVDFPIFTRGGSTTLRNSRIHTTVTCDYINIKSGVGEVIGNTFLGNNAPDTDAIDFDDVVNGIISNNFIYRFQGFNSDGIDIGEGCVDIAVEGNKIYFNSDKGVSIGQASTVNMKRNLIVGCNEAIAVKDAGSVVTVDQCTLVDNQIGVSSFEKNLLKGGGSAAVTNTIIAGSGVAPVQVDALSTLTVHYSASDALTPLVGTGNLNVDPQFTDPTVLNFQLQVGSPCIDAGDPSHGQDPDMTRADIGALYAYSSTDFPFTLEQIVVVNEVMANSGATDPDWIELHNRSGAPADISGWFLSDSASDFAKYRIPNGTVVPAGGYVTFYEDAHFGAASIDPGRITPFAFSENGETAYLHSAVNDELTDYLEQEKFGASRKQISHGYYLKLSTGTYNFLALKHQTPTAPNSSPMVGPIVISEIMYNPTSGGDAEYIELLNITDATVTLYDAASGAAWKISDGVEYEFSKNTPVTMTPGERILLVKNLTVFNATSSVPAGTQLFEWTTGGLSNGGERVQLVMPGGLDSSSILQYIRLDRVNYDDASPWVTTPDGGGPALSKIFEAEYGNDATNWTAAAASPATYAAGSSFAQWAVSESLPAGKDGPLDDADGDGLDNLTEYTLGTDPLVWNMLPSLGETIADGLITLEFDVDTTLTDVDVWIEQSETLEAASWTTSSSIPISYTSSTQRRRVTLGSGSGGRIFYRYVTRKKP